MKKNTQNHDYNNTNNKRTNNKSKINIDIFGSVNQFHWNDENVSLFWNGEWQNNNNKPEQY